MTIKNGQTVSVHYVGTLSDGTEFDNSRVRGAPITFKMGSGGILPAFESALVEMVVGDKKNISLASSEAYGEINPDAYKPFPKNSFPEGFEFEVGRMVQGKAETGQPVMAKIFSLEEDTVVLDFNHPLAGKDINFEIELVEVTDDN
jgi:peptidylprolyl isomerase